MPEKKDVKKCSYCERTLPKFGIERKNGKEDYGHWKRRHLHKKCYNAYFEFLQLKQKYGTFVKTT